jgi:hypothetical protein
VPAAQTPAPAEPAWTRRRRALAAFLARRGLGPRALAVLALGLAAVAAASLGLRHPGLGGLLGLLALLASSLAETPTEAGAPRGPFALGLAYLCDLLLAVGFVAYGAATDDPLLLVLGFGVLLVLALLPYLDALARDGEVATGRALWRRADRLALLLLGHGLGRPGPALVAVLLVGALDAWLRLRSLASPRPLPVPATLDALLDAEGRVRPLARWGSLLVVLLLLLVLPRGAAWRF